jgi:hypothetical protein
VKSKGGAPRGNQNAFKHGRYAKRFLDRRARVRELLAGARTIIAEVNRETARRKAIRQDSTAEIVRTTTRRTLADGAKVTTTTTTVGGSHANAHAW